MNIKDYIPLNWALMSNGYNWVVVTLMVAVAGLALAAIFPKTGAPKNGS